MALKTNYKDDSFQGKRAYRITNSNGTVLADNATIEDVTTYDVVGDSFAAADINATNEAVNDKLKWTDITVDKKSGDSITYSIPGLTNYADMCITLALNGYVGDIDTRVVPVGHKKKVYYYALNNRTVYMEAKVSWTSSSITVQTTGRYGLSNDNYFYISGLSVR